MSSSGCDGNMRTQTGTSEFRTGHLLNASQTQHPFALPMYHCIKCTLKMTKWEMGLFISFNLFCHIFVRPDS